MNTNHSAAHRFVLTLLVGFTALLVSGCGFRNKQTPAGYVGYVTQGSIFGRTTYVGLQQGPTSTGLTFLVNVQNVSVTPFTFDEVFEGNSAIIAKDKLKMSAGVHFIFQVNPERVKDFVEKYTTLLDEQSDTQVIKVAYSNFIQEPLRTSARNRLEAFNGLEISDHINEIGASITEDMRALLSDTPFKLIAVKMGNVQPPENVGKAVSDKVAASQDLQRKDTEILIADKEAERREKEAIGIAKDMAAINGQLTSTYLQYEAIKSQLANINGPNHTTIYIPVGPMGVPIVGSMDISKDTRSISSGPGKQ